MTNGTLGTPATLENGPAETTYSGYSSVWCASEGNCVVRGSYTSTTRHTSAHFVQVESGGVWSPAVAPMSSDWTNSIVALSCSSVNSCIGFGDHLGRAFEETFTKGAWSNSPVVWAPNLAVDPMTSIQMGACAQATCIVVGIYTRAADSYATVGTFAKGAFSTDQDLTLPSDDSATVSGIGIGVSCPTTSTCVTLDRAENLNAKEQAYTVTYTKGVAAAPVATPMLMTSTTNDFGGSISCWAVGDCAIVVRSSSQAFSEIEVAGVWRAPVVLTRDDWTSVSCRAASWCVLVGTTGSEGIASTWSGHSWGPVDAFGTFISLNSVSCWGVNECMAVGAGHRLEANGGHYSDDWVRLWPSGWGRPNLVDPAPGSLSRPLDLTSVSCLKGAVCQVVGMDTSSNTSLAPVTDYYNASQWAPVSSLPWPTVSGLHALNGGPLWISCVATRYCLLAGGASYTNGLVERDVTYAAGMKMSFASTSETILPETATLASVFIPAVTGVACATAADCVMSATDTFASTQQQQGSVPAVVWW